MRRAAWTALLACSLASLVAVAFAQGGAQTHFLTNMPAAGEVATGVVFPAYPNKQFPAGKLADVVLGLRNEGSETYNISMIAGSLNSPVDFSVFVQNFTQMGYGQTVAPGEEISLEYKFQPDPRLEPRDFIVSLTAFYSDSKGQWYSSTFFNETVNIVEVKKLIDWELLFLILLFTAGLAAAGYVAYNYVVSLGLLKPQKKKTRSTRARGEAPVMTAAEQQDWVSGTPYDQFVKSNAKKATKRTAAQ